MSRGTGNAIKRPDHDYVELAVAGVGKQSIETRALNFRAAEPVGIFLDDLETTLRGQAAQIVHLCFRVLIQGRNAHVERGALH
jgi:hypothetical protein